jgi:outer membrane receptor protein involved in Fe transport
MRQVHLAGLSRLLLGASALALLARPALAQSSASSTAEQAPTTVEAITVSGSRVVRDGYQAPTPTTVVGVEQLQAQAAPNVADAINMLPEFSGGTTTHASGGGGSNPSKGTSQLNLRGLGANRTLVLMDGMRVPPAALDGAVDINVLPNALISRIDVVTGGASAAYGSDALTGVVNFVLDRNFTGIKALAQGGVTTYGDDKSYNLTLTGGAPLAGGRGHILLNAEVAKSDGILDMPRDWNRTGWKVLNNPAYTPTNGQPQLLIRSGVGLAQATSGGLINSGPLMGTTFGPGGAPRQFNYGTVALGGVLMEGGEWQADDHSLDSGLDQRVSRSNLFGRVSFDLTDNIEVWSLGSYGYGRATAPCCYSYYLPSVIIQRDNPYIPASVAAQMTALGLTSIPIGRIPTDLPRTQSSNARTMTRFAVGAAGKFDAFGSSWDWDAFAQRGRSENDVNLRTAITPNFRAAIDAVTGPNGSIVCRSTLTNPGNGCSPYSVFGTGVNSQAAINYIMGVAELDQIIIQDTAGISFNGEPFSTWAGPISLATGVEYRKESTKGTTDALSAQNAYFAGNFRPTFGSYDVKEAFAETVIPLAKDVAWAKSLDLNSAVRFTDYSTSGFVTTWKVGATYAPTDDLMFRATRSRDIRAPNLQDLFTAGTRATGSIQDPTRGNATANAQTINIGNLDLKPEVAESTGLGVVYRPSWFRGFSGSIDYYAITINGAISSVGAQDTVNRCAAGFAVFCPSVIRDPVTGTITQVISQQYNLVSQSAKGFDVEASYRRELGELVGGWSGILMLRALATRSISYRSDDGNGKITEAAGTNAGSGPPNWRYLLSASYTNKPLTLTLTGRGVSSGVYDNSYVVCSSNCPASTPLATTIDQNHIAGAFYVDASASYDLNPNVQLFLSVQNVMNKDPAVVAPIGGANFYVSSANPFLYDTLGRQFRFGVRLSM